MRNVAISLLEIIVITVYLIVRINVLVMTIIVSLLSIRFNPNLLQRICQLYCYRDTSISRTW